MQDEKSDIDLLVFMQGEIPSNDLRKQCYNNISNLKIMSLAKDNSDWDNSWSPVNDRILVDDQVIDIGYNTTEWVQLVIKHLMIDNQISFQEFPFRPYTFLGLLETCTVLYDQEDFIKTCQMKIRPMPKRLKKEIINTYWPILKESYEDLIDFSERNIGILSFEFMLFRAIDAIIQLLFAINEVYDPASKRTENYLFQLKQQPPGLKEFINRTLPRFYENKKDVLNFLKSCIDFIQTV